MPQQAERGLRPAPAGSRRVAFGIDLELDGVDVSALAGAAGSRGVPTHVRRVPASELAGRWAGAAPERTREHRARDGRVMLSVDADEARGYLLQTPQDGRFLVSADGLEVLCAPLVRAGHGWTALLVGQLLPLAATLRGLELLHASAVTVDGRALVFAAPVGGGKTSLALRLVLSGAQLLADDAVAIDAGGAVLMTHPGAGALRVRPSEHELLTRSDRERLGGARRTAGRSSYEVIPAARPAPLGALFLLRRVRERSGPIAAPIRAVDPMMLLGSTFNLSVRTPERLRRQLDMCARLAAEIPVLALEITPDVDAATLAAAVREWVPA